MTNLKTFERVQFSMQNRASKFNIVGELVTAFIEAGKKENVTVSTIGITPLSHAFVIKVENSDIKQPLCVMIEAFGRVVATSHQGEIASFDVIGQEDDSKISNDICFRLARTEPIQQFFKRVGVDLQLSLKKALEPIETKQRRHHSQPRRNGQRTGKGLQV